MKNILFYFGFFWRRLQFCQGEPVRAGFEENEIHVVTTFFKGAYSGVRVSEILMSLRKNLANPFVSKVHILWEDVNPLQLLKNVSLQAQNKIVLQQTGSQPTYKDLFEYGNKISSSSGLVLISNADIYFDDSLGCLNYKVSGAQLSQRIMIALSRRHSPLCKEKNDYKNIRDLCLHYIGSHDVFIFRIPFAEPALFDKLDFNQNVGLGVENRVLWEFQHAGYKVINPCERIRSYHLHCSNERTYRNKGKQVSMKKYNNGQRRHGWVKPWWYEDEFKCPFSI
eukprot:snap_masked-scaffold_35-processed-gene-1.37-mRNA-1 protein AED:1.00 eAED:1.00 QI:0/0/0/0/1/1/2/0/280